MRRRSRNSPTNAKSRWSLVYATTWLTVLLVVAIPAVTQTEPAPGITPAQLGSISGTLADRDGAVVANARVALAQAGATQRRETLSDGSGHFIFNDVTPGPFQLTVNATGFAVQDQAGLLHPGEALVLPQTVLAVAIQSVDVTVLPPELVAEQQIKQQERQRLFGVVPNFYVSYVPNPVPLTRKQKFELAWKTTIDPVSFVIAGGIAGIEQADNAFGAYGQGAQGYAKRYAASYADFVSGTFIGGAILPSLLKQDPRYYYRGTGTRKSRVFYAIANSVICKGDNGHWQPNYSGIAGGLAAGGISNLYYPDADRNGARLTFENTLIGIGGTALGNIVQEFIFRKVTPKVPNENSTNPRN